MGKEQLFLEGGRRECVGLGFLSSHLLIFFHGCQKTLSSEGLQLYTTGINRKELSHVSGSFDMRSVKYSLYAAWVLQLTVDILDLKTCFGFSF